MEGHITKHKFLHHVLRLFAWVLILAFISNLVNKFFKWYREAPQRSKILTWIVGIIFSLVMIGMAKAKVNEEQAFNNRWNEKTWTSQNSRDLQTRDSLERLGLKDQYSK